MLGAAIGEAGQPAHGGFVFLGDALPQAGNLTVILLCVHERVPSFCMLSAQCLLASHANEEGRLPLARKSVSCLPRRPSHALPASLLLRSWKQPPQGSLNCRNQLVGLERLSQMGMRAD